MGFGMGHGRSSLGPGLILGVILIYLAYFLLTVVIMNAVFRSVLRPDERSFASLRLGGDEWRMFGLVIIVLIATIILSFIVQLLMMMVGALLVAIAGDNMMLAGAFGFVLFIAYIVGLVWLSVRLSLLYPVTFYRRSISLDTAWGLTRGNFWPLFASYLVVGIIFFVIAATMFFFTFGGLFAEMARAGDDPIARQMAAAQFAAQIGTGSIVTRLLVGILWGVVMTVFFAVWNGMLATATRELMLESGELTEDVERTAEIFE
jgi:hypothetical protein